MALILKENECDALREMGNIGAAHAATVLSQMLNSQVEMSVPEIQVVDISEAHRYIDNEVAVLVIFQIQGEVKNGGYVLLHLQTGSALRLTDIMLGLPSTAREFSESDRSTLMELGNIMVSSFLDATANLLGIMMIPSPPELTIDIPHAVFQSLLAMEGVDIDEVVLFRTELTSEEHRINSNLMLLPNPPMLDEIIRILNQILQIST
ncbi:MAG: chemotaxis protein CheC [Methanomicrobiales archaeon]|nr:chemotaxis protein CheC [Methanomicrobiales archaeon]